MRERKRPPVHPGRIIRAHHLEPLHLTITDLSKILGVSRKTASAIINERGSVTPDMALRLGRAFNTTPQLWLGLQQEYDLWHAARESKDWKMVKRIPWNEEAALCDGIDGPG
jgi:addiction module HigA family antidote